MTIDIDVFLIGGQSNAAGRTYAVDGGATPAVATTKVLQYYNDGSDHLIDANDPVGNGTHSSDWDSPVAAGSFVVGTSYRILSVGSTNFTAIGAASNTVGEVFFASGAGIGTGTAAEGTATRGGPIVAGSFLVGTTYRIISIGTTNFTLVGAASNTVGVVFTATGEGTGNGTAAEGDIGSAWPSFGQTYWTVTGRQICFVPMAVSGSAQVAANDDGHGNWDTTGALYAASNAALTSALAYLVTQGYTPTLKGILWHQGEKDAIGTPTNYADRLAVMIGNYRTYWAGTTPNLPFYIFRLGSRNPPTTNYAGYATIRDAQEARALSDPYTEIIYRKAITFYDRGLMSAFTGDQFHYTKAGLNEMGRMGANSIVAGIFANIARLVNPADYTGTLRATGLCVPSCGAGVEIAYTGNQGYVVAYSRDTDAYKPLNLGGSTFAIGIGDTGPDALTAFAVVASGTNYLTVSGGADPKLSTSAGALEIGSHVQITGFTPPTAGSGLEFAYTGGTGYMVAYNRSGSAYLPIVISGSTILLQSSTNVVNVDNGTFTTAVGYRDLYPVTKSDNYTCVLADAGCGMIQTSAGKTFTIPSNASVPYPVGTVLTFTCSGGNVSIAINSDTLYLAGVGTTGTRTLANTGIATAWKVSTTAWFISGSGLT